MGYTLIKHMLNYVYISTVSGLYYSCWTIHPCLSNDSIEPVSWESELAILARESSLHRMQLSCLQSLDSLRDVSWDEVAPHISWRWGSHGFVPREPAEEKAALLRGTVALVTHAVPVDTLSLLLSSANRTSAPTAARSGTSLSHPLCHMPHCQSHSQILIMSAKHFFRRASPTAGCLLQIS